ncbi:hypothetical protein AMAG_09185 [Allomyces macrogynus ATCC 38327]|uniref:Uncharacterized protein n=1 Tax=Allomyces macrogynus (strain ATCC 38327) TaxID=578462 RepID=A0A0L0SNM4_ALLM3|nr:hypothetical protein AMAG_09185 [Allomyces macrogynus ATCC 38327]|eukprot:KNE64126.1 hypothetical protein AMAG_09185 [Allomyces macrogynus ATCC 38327]
MMAGATSGSSSGSGTVWTSPRKNVSHAPTPTGTGQQVTKVGVAIEPGCEGGGVKSPVGVENGNAVHDLVATPSHALVPLQTLAATPLPPSPVPGYLEWCAQQSQKRVHPNIEIPEPDAPSPSHPDTHLPARPAQLESLLDSETISIAVPMAVAPPPPPPPPPNSNYLEWCAHNSQKRVHPKIAVPGPRAADLVAPQPRVAPDASHLSILLKEVLKRPRSPLGPEAPQITASAVASPDVFSTQFIRQSPGSPRCTMLSSQTTSGPAIHFPEVVQWRVSAHLYHTDRPALARLSRVSGDWYAASVRTAMWHASESWLPLETHLCARSSDAPTYRIDTQFVLESMMSKDTPFGMIAWVPGAAPRAQKPSYDVIQRYHAHRRVRLGLPLSGMLRKYAVQPAKPGDPTTEDEFKAMFTEIPGTPDQIYLVWADPDVDVDDQHHFGLRLVPGVTLLHVPDRAFRTCALRGRVPKYRMPHAIPPQITTLVVAGPVAPEGVNNLLNGGEQYLHLTTLDLEIVALELELGGIVAEAVARMPKLLALKLRSAMVLPDDALARVMTAVGRSVRELDLYTVLGKQTAQTIAQQPWIHTLTHIGLELIPADFVPVLRNLTSFTLRCSALTHNLATRTGQVLVNSARTLHTFVLDQALAPASHVNDAMHLISILAAVPATVTDLTVQIHQTVRVHPTPRRIGGIPAETAWTFPPELQRLRVGVFETAFDLAAWVAAVPESVATLRVEDARGTSDCAVVEALAVWEMAGKARRAAVSRQTVVEATGVGEGEECVADDRVEKVVDDAVEQEPVEKSATVAAAPPDEPETTVTPARRVLSTEELEWDEYVRWADKLLDA